MRAVVLLSGGMDSATVLWDLVEDCPVTRIHAVSFDYGQRHRRELEAAANLSGRLGVRHTVVRLDMLLPGSALTDSSIPVPEGHYAAESMRATIVPNRNAVFLSLAFAVAIVDGADLVAFGCHAGDHPIYPDCRPAFVEAFDLMENVVQADDKEPCRLVTPFLNMTKAEIVSEGTRLGVPWEATWSCYQGRDVHCGRCGTCVERREAFQLAGVVDPTAYEAT